MDLHGIEEVRNTIKSWLTDEEQIISISVVKSEWGVVLNGVPQGSVFGQLLFLLHDVDLIEINSILNIYPDVTKTDGIISSADDKITLQEIIDKLLEWRTTLRPLGMKV